MCGIFSKLTLYQFDAENIARKALNILKHRGPDQRSFINFLERSANIVVGMTRLSIVDPHGGKQPIISRDGSIIVIFNGQMYNYQANPSSTI